MKLGIMIVGDTSQRNRDWKRCVDNINKNLISCWGADYETSVYTVTDHIPPENFTEMKTVYNVKRFAFDYVNNIIGKYLTAMDLIKDEDVDFVICTRPDIVFLKRVIDLNIDFTKFNFLFKEKDQFSEEPMLDGKWLQLCCDNFFAFPKKYAQVMKQSILDREIRKNEVAAHVSAELHTIHKFVDDLIGVDNIHYITEPQGSGSSDNDVYKLDRYDCVPGDLG